MMKLPRRIWPFRRPEPPADPRARLGRRGEDFAVQYLRARGYRILHRNLRFQHLELDIVAQCDDTVVFVEVRAVMRGDFIAPEDSIGPAKRRKVRAAVKQFIARNYEPDTYYRIDILGLVYGDALQPEVTHIENAF